MNRDEMIAALERIDAGNWDRLYGHGLSKEYAQNVSRDLEAVLASLRSAPPQTEPSVKEALAWAYQFAGARGACVEALDNLSALSHGNNPPHEWPVVLPAPPQEGAALERAVDALEDIAVLASSDECIGAAFSVLGRITKMAVDARAAALAAAAPPQEGMREALETFVYWSERIADLAGSEWASETPMPGWSLSQACHWMNESRKAGIAALAAPQVPTSSRPALSCEYVGEELAIFWQSPYGHGKEKIASFWWPFHPAEATAEVEATFEAIAQAAVAAWNAPVPTPDAITAAVVAEREACAKAGFDAVHLPEFPADDPGGCDGRETGWCQSAVDAACEARNQFAAAIRARTSAYLEAQAKEN